MHYRLNTLILASMLWIAAPAQAQLGPRPSEIPATQPDAVEEASRSARARPAIDELLLAQARTVQPVQQSEPVTSSTPATGSLQNDLRSGETLPALPKEQPVTLIGSTGSDEEGSGFASIDKGWVQTLAALGGVLLLILGLSQLFKRLARSQGGLVGKIGAGGNAPTGILEVIGRYPIGSGMTLVVLKFDQRVLLVANSTATRGKHARGASMQTLCELSDPEDVASVLLKSRSSSGETIARSFERALQEADDLTDDSIYGYDEPVRASAQMRMPQQQQGEPDRTITSVEGDRAELWSTGTTGQAAAGVLRKRLATMRREHKGA